MKTSLTHLLLALAATSLSPLTAQDSSAPEAPPIAPVDGASPGVLVAGKADAKKPLEKTSRPRPETAPTLTADISKACKEREKRMTALNDAMLKLREAGDEEEATRIQNRLLAMIETKDPREDDALMANKAELMALRRSLADLTSEVATLTNVLEQNSRIIDEILKKAVPDISPAVIDEMKKQAKNPEIRKVP